MEIMALAVGRLGLKLYSEYQKRNIEEESLPEPKNQSLTIYPQKSWKKINKQKLSKMIQETKIKEFFISKLFPNRENHEQPQLLKEIMKINLESIVRLDISDNQIESIENFSRIFLPNLQYLEMTNNNIVFLKEMRKIESSNITWLQTQNNKIIDYPFLSQMEIKELQWFWIQFFQNDREFSNIQWIFSIPTDKLSRLYLFGGKRIHQKQLYSCLKRKYFDLDLRTSSS